MSDAFDNTPLQTVPECFASHMVPWMIRPDYIQTGLRLALQGVKPSHEAIKSHVEPKAEDGDSQGNTAQSFITQDGIGVIAISGAMMKPRSKFGGTSSVDVRRQVRAMANDKDVRAIMLHIDSPGGTVAGTEELAADIIRAKKKKPMYTHFSDTGASAAVWIGVQSDFVTANKSAIIGSLGTVAVLHDQSKAAEMEGVKVHVISTGLHKGAGVPGSEILPEHLAEAQRLVDALNEDFMDAVASGRKMSRAGVDAIADGRVWKAPEAKGLGLIDAVMTFDEALQNFRANIEAPSGGMTMRHRNAQAMILLSDI